MKVTPIQAEHLGEVGRFLNEHLARRIAPEAWVQSLQHRWAAEQPNHGMQLRDDDGRLGGVILAVYSDQQVNGRAERFCNPHSWCVLDQHRHASIGLVLPLIKQPGYHFTMFTPNPKVAQVFLGLRFRLLDDALLHFPNLPSLRALGGGERFVEARREHIAARLTGAPLHEFEAHAAIPWLEFVAFGAPGDACLVIYKRSRWKKMPCAGLVHVSSPAAFGRHGHLLRHHLLMRGMPVSGIEARFLSVPPPLALRGKRLQPKLVSTRTLGDGEVRDVYSELMALDI